MIPVRAMGDAVPPTAPQDGHDGHKDGVRLHLDCKADSKDDHDGLDRNGARPGGTHDVGNHIDHDRHEKGPRFK